jgi:hypothetical protein
MTPSAARADEIKQTFRGRSYDPKSFITMGASKLLRAEPQGLRITLPAQRNSRQPVGFTTRFALRGDFEITLAYEVVRVEKPTTGYGAGINIWIRAHNLKQDAATIGRMVDTGGKQYFGSHRAFDLPDGKRQNQIGKPHPTEKGSGKLRLARSGPTLKYLVAEGDSNQFQEVYESEFGADDVDMVRFAVENWGSPTIADFRIKSLNIRADAFPTSLPPIPRPRKPWVVWLAVALSVAILAGLGVWLWLRSQQTGAAVAATAEHA